MPQQQISTGPAPMERVERTNVVMVNPQQRARFSQKNLYAMDIDRREIRNCYTCEDFGHLTRNCRNRRVGINRRMEMDNNNNLNGEGDLIVFN